MHGSKAVLLEAFGESGRIQKSLNYGVCDSRKLETFISRKLVFNLLIRQYASPVLLSADFNGLQRL